MTADTGTPRLASEREEASRAPASRPKFFIAVFACLVGIAILIGLGTWQVERLAWKEALIARIDARIHAEPLDLAAAERRHAESGDIDYTPLTVTGRFFHQDERYFFSTFGGSSGWNVFTPMVTDEGPVLFVNRGFVPYEMRDPQKRLAGLPKDTVTVTGLARDALTEKPGYFIPENDIARHSFYWRDLAGMTQGADLPQGAEVEPFFLDAGPGRAAGGWPVGGTTVIDIANNHLQYAFTWYGLAVVLVVMTGMLVVRDYRQRRGR